MKDRLPKSFASALTKIKTALGEEHCASLVGRSESLVRKWADPDHPSVPSTSQALILDIAYAQAGHGEPPIYKVYEELLEAASRMPEAEIVDLVDSTLNLHSIVGELSQAIREATGPAMPPGASLSENQRARLLAVLDRLDGEVDRLEDSIEQS